ncbi:hypothetical protein KUTeg_002251, partial [Tegillarca granosa]
NLPNEAARGATNTNHYHTRIYQSEAARGATNTNHYHNRIYQSKAARGATNTNHYHTRIYQMRQQEEPQIPTIITIESTKVRQQEGPQIHIILMLELTKMRQKKWLKYQPLSTRIYQSEAARWATNTYHSHARIYQNMVKPREHDNTLFIARITDWLDNSLMAHGTLMRSLGEAGEIEPETERILIENDVDYSEFPQKYSHHLGSNSIADILLCEKDCQFVYRSYRRDFRDVCVFTIDPSTARDLDDAVSIEKLKDGTYEVGVHIADVSHFLKEGTFLDSIASRRATSVYLVQKVIPMLPRILCEQLCSLNPDEDKLTFSVVWKMSDTGEGFIEEPDKVWKTEELPSIARFSIEDIKKRVLMLNQIAVRLRKKRFDGGALRLDKVKVQFSLDPETGLPNGYSTYEQKDSNRISVPQILNMTNEKKLMLGLIEEFMLLANMAVAHKINSTYPSLGSLCLDRSMIFFLQSALCESLGVPLNTSSSGSLQESLWTYCGDNEFSAARMQVLVNLCLKSMQNAVYFCNGSIEDEELYRHYALNVPLYTHFTSPIRRYADVMVHRQLAAALGITKKSKRNIVHIQKQAEQCNDKKRNSKIVQELSTELFFAVFVKEICLIQKAAGPFEEKAVVMGKLNLKGTSYNKEERQLTITWTATDTCKEEITQSITMFSVIDCVVQSNTKDSPLAWKVILKHPKDNTTSLFANTQHILHVPGMFDFNLKSTNFAPKEHVVTLVIFEHACVPLSSYNPHTKPYWKKDVKQAHSNERKMRNIWLLDGKPRGFQHVSYANYKAAKDCFRRVQKAASEKHLEETYSDIDRAAGLVIRLFWKLINAKRKKTNKVYPEIIVNGEMFTNPEDVAGSYLSFIFELLLFVTDSYLIFEHACVPLSSYNPHTKPYWKKDVKQAHSNERKMRNIWLLDGNHEGFNMCHMQITKLQKTVSDEYRKPQAKNIWRKHIVILTEQPGLSFGCSGIIFELLSYLSFIFELLSYLSFIFELLSYLSFIFELLSYLSFIFELLSYLSFIFELLSYLSFIFELLKSSTGFIPEICDILHQYQLQHYLQNYINYGQFPTVNEWKNIVSKTVKTVQFNAWLQRTIIHPDFNRFLCLHNTNRSPALAWTIAKCNNELELCYFIIQSWANPFQSNTTRYCNACFSDITEESIQHAVCTCPATGRHRTAFLNSVYMFDKDLHSYIINLQTSIIFELLSYLSFIFELLKATPGPIFILHRSKFFFAKIWFNQAFLPKTLIA